MTPEHPDALTDYRNLKQICRGSMQAIEDKAIADYMRLFDEQGREAAEKEFFKHFNKVTDGVDKRKGRAA